MQANDVASVILSRSAPWTDAMKLQKLLYYVQAWHLAITDEPLFPEQIKAWKDGPVVPQVWHERKDKASRRAATQDVEHAVVDQMTSDIVDLVIAAYGSMSGEELSALTHVEQPWNKARGDRTADAESSIPIAENDMAAFYRAHRLLGGRTAADLAAGGIYVWQAPHDARPIDVDAIFAALDSQLVDPGTDCWGGANLMQPSGSETPEAEQPVTRSYADV